MKVLPAHAGVIPEKKKLQKSTNCITRTCGGDPDKAFASDFGSPYYPHMRGWSQVELFQTLAIFVLPAHAGVILAEQQEILKANRITRTCGGDPETIPAANAQTEYYPHMRGWSCRPKRRP